MHSTDDREPVLLLPPVLIAAYKVISFVQLSYICSVNVCLKRNTLIAKSLHVNIICMLQAIIMSEK